MAYRLLEEKDITKLERKISLGDVEALKQLRKESARVVKAANSRLLRLERAGYTESNALQRAEYYTSYKYGSERFRVNKSMSADDLIEQYREVRLFMRKESSTIRGMKASQARLTDALDAYGIKIPDDQRRAFFKFVNSDDVQDAISFIGDYDVVMDAIANHLDRIQNDFENLQKEFQRFLVGDIFYDQLLERISGETYETLYQRSRHRGIDYDARRAGRKRNQRLT